MSIMAAGILDQIEALRARGEEFCVVTVVRTADATSAKAGAKAVVSRDGEISGFVGGACVQGSVRRAAGEVLGSGEAKLIRVKPKEAVKGAVDADGTELHSSACPSGGTVELFIEPMLLAPRVVVMGASPVGAALVSLANAMGYRTLAACAIDEQALMPDAGTYAEGFDLSAHVPAATDALVIATQGRADRKALESAAKSDAGYIAFVGSHRKGENLKAALAGAGCDPALLARVKTPAGLDIGAIEPEEIAVSIMAEIIRWRRSRQTARANDHQEGQ